MRSERVGPAADVAGAVTGRHASEAIQRTRARGGQAEAIRVAHLFRVAVVRVVVTIGSRLVFAREQSLLLHRALARWTIAVLARGDAISQWAALGLLGSAVLIAEPATTRRGRRGGSGRGGGRSRGRGGAATTSAVRSHAATSHESERENQDGPTKRRRRRSAHELTEPPDEAKVKSDCRPSGFREPWLYGALGPGVPEPAPLRARRAVSPSRMRCATRSAR